MTISSPLSPEAERWLLSELKLTESLIWSGKPLAYRALLGTLHFFLFGILWTAACVVITICHVDADFLSGMVVDVPFILLGLWLLSMPFWMWRKAKKTVYAITDTRVLILSPAWYGGISTRSIAPEDFRARTLTQQPNGSGTIVFTRLTTTRRSGGGGTYEVRVGFENIPDVRDVDALLDRSFTVSEKH